MTLNNPENVLDLDLDLGVPMAKPAAYDEKGVLLFLLENQFGDLPEWVLSRIEHSDSADLERWTLNIFAEETLEAILD